MLWLVPVVLAVAAAPSSVTSRYSGVYDSMKRDVLPACPPLDEVMPRITHAQALWEREGSGILERLRT